MDRNGTAYNRTSSVQHSCGDGDGSCCSESVADVGDNAKGDRIGDEEG